MNFRCEKNIWTHITSSSSSKSRDTREIQKDLKKEKTRIRTTLHFFTFFKSPSALSENRYVLMRQQKAQKEWFDLIGKTLPSLKLPALYLHFSEHTQRFQSWFQNWFHQKKVRNKCHQNVLSFKNAGSFIIALNLQRTANYHFQLTSWLVSDWLISSASQLEPVLKHFAHTWKKNFQNVGNS